MPPWGLAAYRDAALQFSVTLCFECANAYVYTHAGRSLRAFAVTESHAVQLLAFLNERLPLT